MTKLSKTAKFGQIWLFDRAWLGQPAKDTPLFYNGITEGACDTLSETHFKNPQAIYSGTCIKKAGLESWPFLLEAKTSSAEARTLEF